MSWLLRAILIAYFLTVAVMVARADETRTVTVPAKVWRALLWDCHVRASAPLSPGPNSGFLIVQYTGTPERMACAQKILDKAATPGAK